MGLVFFLPNDSRHIIGPHLMRQTAASREKRSFVWNFAQNRPAHVDKCPINMQMSRNALELSAKHINVLLKFLIETPLARQFTRG